VRFEPATQGNTQPFFQLGGWKSSAGFDDATFVVKRIHNTHARKLLETAMKHPHYFIKYQVKQYLDTYTE
jgi:hypothetical protein